jgi:hypothetical protein
VLNAANQGRNPVIGATRLFSLRPNSQWITAKSLRFLDSGFGNRDQQDRKSVLAAANEANISVHDLFWIQDPSWLEGLVVSLVERTDESPINGRGGSNRI